MFMKKLIIWCAALLLLASCGGQASKVDNGNTASAKDSDSTSKSKTIEMEFIATPDSLLAGKWVPVNVSDSVELTLGVDGSVSMKGMLQPYTNWKQVMANVIVLTRPGSYAGNVVDTAVVDVDACPMTLSVKGTHSLHLKHN